MAIGMADLSERIERLEAREQALRVALGTVIKIVGESEDATLPALVTALKACERDARKMNASSETIACLQQILSYIGQTPTR